MQMFLRAARLGLAAAAIAALPAQAQEPVSAALKLRAGMVSGPVTDVSRGRRTQGLGLELATKAGKGQVFLELTYDLFNGYRKDVTQLGGGAWYAGDGTQDPLNPSAPSQTYGGHALITEAGNSLFSEMLEYQGFGARVGYRAALPFAWAEGWDWQAGASIDRRETRHEVQMTLTPGYMSGTDFIQIDPVVPRLDTTYYEGARFTNVTYKMQFGAFAGVSHTFGDIFRTEINARYTTFNTPHYNPFTYTGKVPSIGTSSKGGLVLEVAIGIAL
jgi:hypothetical protein